MASAAVSSKKQRNSPERSGFFMLGMGGRSGVSFPLKNSALSGRKAHNSFPYPALYFPEGGRRPCTSSQSSLRKSSKADTAEEAALPHVSATDQRAGPLHYSVTDETKIATNLTLDRKEADEFASVRSHRRPRQLVKPGPRPNLNRPLGQPARDAVHASSISVAAPA